MNAIRPLALTLLTTLAALCAASGQPAEQEALQWASAQAARELLDDLAGLVGDGDEAS
ncbi:MAG: hypothetical protein U1F56_08310 [Rubrivivax sp.]